MTRQSCLDSCRSRKPTYGQIGVQGGNVCWCFEKFHGTIIPNAVLVPCGGDPTTKCGGSVQRQIQYIQGGPNSVSSATETATTTETSNADSSSEVQGQDGEQSNDDLSGGAIAGIVIGSVVGVILVLIIGFAIGRTTASKDERF